MRTVLLSAGVCVVALTVVSARHAGTPAQVAFATAPQSSPYDETADARHDIAAALALAKVDKKNVLLDFGANWCPDCLVLSKLFDDDTVKPYRELNFHVVPIDVGRWTKNLDLNKEYGSPIDKGIPAVVVLAPDGRMVDSTKDGQLESARKSTPAEILGYLKKWAPASR